MPHRSGVVFPVTDPVSGRRSTSATGRAIVADALRPVDPVGASGAARESSWRQSYLPHFRRLVEAGLDSPDAAHTIAASGIASLHERMRWVTATSETGGSGEGGSGGHGLHRDSDHDSRRDVSDGSLEDALDNGDDGDFFSEQLDDFIEATSHGAREPGRTGAGWGPEFGTEVLAGRGTPETELSIPYRGGRLSGDALRRQLDTWVDDGIVEEGLRTKVTRVMDNPAWLRAEGRRVVVLGASAEMGPLRALLRWGADVAALDLPRSELWRELLTETGTLAGTLTVPVADGPRPVHERAGADIVADLGRVTRWVGSLAGPLVLGNYVYADGATNVRATTAIDAMLQCLVHERGAGDIGLALLATPTDTFAVPEHVVAESARRYAQARRSPLRAPVRALSGGRLLRRSYVPTESPGINDSVVLQQGPNYLLAKRIQRWRATVHRHDGGLVSFTVAPPTRTRSVLKNRALAAAYAGAHRFGVEVFEPGTANTLMAAVLVHDLHEPPAAHEHTWQDEADAAAHGGLWTCAYEPRSALGLAALLGFASAR